MQGLKKVEAGITDLPNGSGGNLNTAFELFRPHLVARHVKLEACAFFRVNTFTVAGDVFRNDPLAVI